MNIYYLKGRRTVVRFADQRDQWDIFVSAYNESGRVRIAFEKIAAHSKVWVSIPEYAYTEAELSCLSGVIRCDPSDTESAVVQRIVECVGVDALRTRRVCIDITGFMRPQILFMIKYLVDTGVKSFWLAYSEPERYSRKEHTAFSKEEISNVRQVHGYEGVHSDDMTRDVLMVGVGYDDALISRVINDKDSARLVQMLSLPSLSADMYQESVLRLDRTGANTDLSHDNRVIFAPANDPFVIAAELSDKYKDLCRGNQVSNLYLSPLATKPQAVGFALFYLHELTSEPASIVFPFARFYERETSKGIGRTWLYHVEL
jgi:hypothetical protein